MRELIRTKQYSPKTEQSYLSWIKRCILFQDKQYPKAIASEDLENYLSFLAVDRNVAASTQNQAHSAILFLYNEVLDILLSTDFQFIGAKKPPFLPAQVANTSIFSHNLRTVSCEGFASPVHALSRARAYANARNVPGPCGHRA